MTQRDEPNQKNCIFKLKKKQTTSTKPTEKYCQIRVKSIDFLQKPATAIYFYDFTSQIAAMELGSKLLQQEKKNEKLSMSQVTMSHEFRAPLTSTLMMLEGMLAKLTDENLRKITLIVVSQMNLLLCLVNDLLDLKMIE